jgi:hypothetical protein
MDKTLKRPLFKQKAMEAYKSKHGGKVPGYVVGAAIQGVRALAAPTYRYLAPKMSSFFARPGVQTGLTGLEAYGIGVGSREMAEGISEGDTGKFLSGAAYAVPGMAFLPSTARKSGIAALRETGEYLAPRATDLTEKIVGSPFKAAGAFTGLGVAGQVLSPDEAEAAQPTDEMTEEQYEKDIQDRLIYTKPVYSESFSGAEQPSLVEPARPIGVKSPKTEGEKTLNAQLQQMEKVNEVADKLGVRDASKASDQQIKQIAIESNVDEPTLRNMIGRPQKQSEVQGPPAPSVPTLTGNEGEGELEYLRTKRKRDLSAAQELGAGFKEFRNQLNEITGTSNQNLNDLIAMKAAATLLTGKTSEKGLRGLLDVGGQALGTTADSLLALKMSQQDSDLKLAQAYLQMKQKQGDGTKMLTTGDKTIRVNDPSVPGGFRNVRVSLGEDNKYYMRQFDPTTGEQSFAQANFTGTDVKRNDDKLNAALMNLEENRRGGKMVDFVIENFSKGGTKAAIGLLAEDTLGTLDFFAGGNLGGDTSTIDDQIRNEMMKTTGREAIDFTGSGVNVFRKESENMQDRFNADLEDAKKNGAEKVEKELRKAGIIAKGFRPSEKDLKTYTQLALIEQRMKYIVANANKSEDRLTQKDIDNAAKRTQIIKFITSPRTIRLNYEALRGEFDDKAESFLNQYKLNGGDEGFVQTNFMDIPGVYRAYAKKNQAYMQQQNIQNQQSRKDVLGSIPIYGGK